MSNSSSNKIGISFIGALTLMFIFLKLWGKIDWAWYWVISPIWIYIAFILAIIILVIIGVTISHFWKKGR